MADGREWILDTSGPSLADVSGHFLLTWMVKFRGLRDLIDIKTYPKAASVRQDPAGPVYIADGSTHTVAHPHVRIPREPEGLCAIRED